MGNRHHSPLPQNRVRRHQLGRHQCNSTVTFSFNLFTVTIMSSPQLGAIFHETSIRNSVYSEISSSPEDKALAIILIIKNYGLHNTVLPVRKLSILVLILA